MDEFQENGLVRSEQNMAADESGFSEEDIAAEYARAVEAMDEADWGIADVATAVDDTDGNEAEIAVSSDRESSDRESEPVGDIEAPAPPPGNEPVSTTTDQRDETEEQRFTPEQILEASLFVGGKPLSSKKLAGLLGGSFDSSGVQALAEQLNYVYEDQARPYEIRLVEGGYYLSLREKYAPVRARVFGTGPRDVRLSQDALEVLSFVAYRQPVTREDVEETGKQNARSLLSQLVRRELIAIERDVQDAKRVQYHTTPRFLSLFGVGSLDELPQADVLSHK